MKKILILLTAICIGIACFSQNNIKIVSVPFTKIEPYELETYHRPAQTHNKKKTGDIITYNDNTIQIKHEKGDVELFKVKVTKDINGAYFIDCLNKDQKSCRFVMAFFHDHNKISIINNDMSYSYYFK